MARILGKTEQKILDALEKEPQSTKSLLDSLDDFENRASLSLFLNGMMRDGLIYKQSNGYWKMQKFEGTLQKEQYDQDIEAVPVFVSKHAEEIDARPQNQIEVSSRDQKSNIDLAIQSIRDMLPENCEVVISAEEVLFKFDGLTFAIDEPGDIDAVVRMRQRYVGSDAA